MKSLNQKNCKKLSLEKCEYSKLKDVVDVSKLGNNDKENFRDEIKDLELIKKYYKVVFQNKRQTQRTNPTADRKLVLRAVGTNRGKTRMPCATVGNRSVVASGPSTVRGGRALKFSLNAKRKKIPLKQKRKAIKLLIYYLLKESELYLLPDDIKSSDKKVFYKILKDESRQVLNSVLAKKRKVLLILNKADKSNKNLFTNLSYDILNEDKLDYCNAINGFHFKRAVFFTKEGLETLLKNLK